MDTVGKLYLGIAAVAVVIAIVGFFVLSKKGPRGAVLALAAILFFLGWSIQPGMSRELHLVVGVLRLTAILGGILGMIDLIRKKPVGKPPATFVDAEIVDEREVNEVPTGTDKAEQDS